MTAAVWVDLNKDGWPDLVVAGEWQPIRFFVNSHGKLSEVTETVGPANMHGMWRSLVATDVDGDGDIDLVAGNLGMNCDYHVGAATPMDLYAADIDNNGRIDPDENIYGTIDQLTHAIAIGKYPSPPARDLYFVTKGAVKNPIVKEFIKWVLTDGQKYVSAAGYIQLPAEKINTGLNKIK